MNCLRIVNGTMLYNGKEINMGDASKDIVVKVPLEVRLTEPELKSLAKEMAEAINQRNRLEGEIETFKAQKKAEITATEAVISRNAVLINQEKEFRLVECRVDYDFKGKGYKTYFRLDTGDKVRSEPITNEERQQMMPTMDKLNARLKDVADRKSKAAGE